MFCIKCGNKLSDNMKFCDQCGAPVPIKVSQDDIKSDTSINEPVEISPDKSNSKSFEDIEQDNETKGENSLNLELHDDIVLEENMTDVDNSESKEDFNYNSNNSNNEDYFYESNRENQNYYREKSAPSGIVNIIAAVSMVLMGLLAIKAIFEFIGSFLFILGGI